MVDIYGQMVKQGQKNSIWQINFTAGITSDIKGSSAMNSWSLKLLLMENLDIQIILTTRMILWSERRLVCLLVTSIEKCFIFIIFRLYYLLLYWMKLSASLQRVKLSKKMIINGHSRIKLGDRNWRLRWIVSTYHLHLPRSDLCSTFRFHSIKIYFWYVSFDAMYDNRKVKIQKAFEFSTTSFRTWSA